MKLSTAIRLGAMLKPQGFGAEHKDGRTCAIGAALDATGFLGVPGGEYIKFPIFLQVGRTLACPLADGDCQWPNPGSLYLAIMHLNDSHEWTREQIADWVETIESRSTVDGAHPEADCAVAPVAQAPHSRDTRDPSESSCASALVRAGSR